MKTAAGLAANPALAAVADKLPGAQSGYLNQPPRTVTEAIYERALQRIARHSDDRYAREQADEALFAASELRKREKQP
jgi:hypothetical protein